MHEIVPEGSCYYHPAWIIPNVGRLVLALYREYLCGARRRKNVGNNTCVRGNISIAVLFLVLV
jgi:hypothetical protein